MAASAFLSSRPCLLCDSAGIFDTRLSFDNANIDGVEEEVARRHSEGGSGIRSSFPKTSRSFENCHTPPSNRLLCFSSLPPFLSFVQPKCGRPPAHRDTGDGSRYCSCPSRLQQQQPSQALRHLPRRRSDCRRCRSDLAHCLRLRPTSR